MSDDLRADPSAPATAPDSSLAVAQAVLRAGDGSLPELVGVGRGAPAFLMPTSRAAAAGLCTSYNGLRPARRRWERTAVGLAVRAGASGLVSAQVADRGLRLPGMPAQGSLLEELARLLGTEVHAGVGLGTLDAYWKPVLQLVDAAGRPVGFAKVGWTDMTRRLVATEWAALESLADRVRTPVMPAPLLRTSWGPLDVVVTAPLPLDCRRLPDDTTADVPDALARRDDAADEGLVDLAWWQEIVAAADEAAATGRARVGDVPDLPVLLRDLESRIGSDPRPVGVVHGDWVPWNQARRRSTDELVVWDWEYADLRAPLGLDALHARYQVERLLRGASDLEAFDRAHRDAVPALAALHAAMVAGRRCRAALLGADDEATAAELAAATTALRAASTRTTGGQA
jgi:hypothetical protein